MEKKIKFYRCKYCGNIVSIVEGEEIPVCCGEKMEELVANTTEAANEKHIPVYEKEGEDILVTVGEIEHPMENDHYIMWIAQVFGDTVNKVDLKPGQKPEAKFKYIEGAEIYAYCNKHSLWKNSVK